MSAKNPSGLRNRLIGVVLIIISIGIAIIFSDMIVLPERIIERKLLSNQQSIPESILLLRTIILYFLLISLACGLFFVLNIRNLFIRFFGKTIDINALKKFFLSDRMCSKKQMPMFLLVSGVIFGTILQLFFLLNGEPIQEGFLEHISEWILLLSAILLLISTFKVTSNPLFHDVKIKTILILLVISFGLFFLFGEEISWGQRVFGFDSVGIFNQYNYQHETNLHNFFNPLFTLLYPMIGMSSFLILFIFGFFKNNDSDLLDLLLPPPSLYILAFIMACTSYMGHSEIYEELVYDFMLLYSIRILFCLNYPPVKSEKTIPN